MNKAYVNSIIKKLQCSQSKKMEIKRQITADIQSEIKDGAVWEDIVKRMGTPQEIAQEFNQSFSQQEYKKYKKEKRLKIIGIILVCAVFVLAAIYWIIPKQIWLKDSKLFDEEEVIQQAQYVVELFDSGKYEELQQISDEILIEYLNREEFEKNKALIAEDWGKQVSVGQTFAVEVTQMGRKSALVQMYVNYENINILYTVSFNEDMQLQGFFMK